MPSGPSSMITTVDDIDRFVWLFAPGGDNPASTMIDQGTLRWFLERDLTRTVNQPLTFRTAVEHLRTGLGRWRRDHRVRTFHWTPEDDFPRHVWRGEANYDIDYRDVFGDDRNAAAYVPLFTAPHAEGALVYRSKGGRLWRFRLRRGTALWLIDRSDEEAASLNLLHLLDAFLRECTAGLRGVRSSPRRVRPVGPVVGPQSRAPFRRFKHWSERQRWQRGAKVAWHADILSGVLHILRHRLGRWLPPDVRPPPVFAIDGSWHEHTMANPEVIVFDPAVIVEVHEEIVD